MRIFIIGFMGCGKSYTGKQLAQQMGMSFIDLDEYIENKFGKTIREIFATAGESHFRKIEKDCLHEMKNYEQTVISTGGGTPCFFENMKWMNENGITIFLDTSVKLLIQRLELAMENRPLLQNLSTKKLEKYIVQKLEERNPFYHQAQVIYLQKKEGQAVAEEVRKYLTPRTFLSDEL